MGAIVTARRALLLRAAPRRPLVAVAMVATVVLPLPPLRSGSSSKTHERRHIVREPIALIDGDEVDLLTHKAYGRSCLLYTSPSPRD